MRDDLTVAAVRKVRTAISKQFNDDPKQLVEHYREYQKKFGTRVKEPSLAARVEQVA